MKYFNVLAGLCLLLAVSGSGPISASAQLDSARTHSKPVGHFVLSLGLDTHFPEVGAIGGLTILIDRDVFDVSYSSVSSGNVITDSHGGSIFDLFSSASVTSYAAKQTEVISLSYGKKVSNGIWLTSGLAWVSDVERSSTNAHTDPGGLFTPGDYHADLVEHSTSYLAIPVTLTMSAFNSNSWIGMNLHAQMLASLNGVRFSAEVSLGFGSFPE